MIRSYNSFDTLICVPWQSARLLVREAVCCSVLQCVVMFCGVLQCAASCCSVLQCVAVCCSVLQCVAVCCSVLQCVAVCCIVLQCVAVNCSVFQSGHSHLKEYLRFARKNGDRTCAFTSCLVGCSVQTATHCNTLQHIAMCFDTFQHTATR